MNPKLSRAEVLFMVVAVIGFAVRNTMPEPVAPLLVLGVGLALWLHHRASKTASESGATVQAPTKRTIKVMADYNASPLWLENAGRDSGNIRPSDLGVSEPLASDLLAWAPSTPQR